jgi:hypothetical protein
MALLGLLCLEERPSRFWFPIAVSSFMLLAMQVRAEWVGFGLSMLIWGILGKKLNRVALVVALVVTLLAIGFVADIRMPNISTRGGEISTKEIVARGVAAVNPDLAKEYSTNTKAYAGTVQWRTKWWKAIRESVSIDNVTLLFGNGYGFPLKNLVPYTRKLDIRTPHSVFYFALGYSGCIGVVLFFTVLGCIFQLLWRTYQVTGQPFGLAFWASVTVSAFFGNLFETPAGAIPVYILVGLCIAPGLTKQRLWAEYPLHENIPMNRSAEPVLVTPIGGGRKVTPSLGPAWDGPNRF